MFDLSYAVHAMVITPFWFIIAGHALHIAFLYRLDEWFYHSSTVSMIFW